MRKLIVTVLLIFWVVNNNAQEVRLTIDCPELQPRVHEQFSINMDVSFLDSAYLKLLPDNFFLVSSNYPFGYPGYPHSWNMMAKDTGTYVIGPYEFEFNHRKYKTNQIQIKVLNALEKEDGIWIRLIKTEKSSFIILEQNKMTLNDIEIHTGKSAKSLKEMEFAELIKNPIQGLTLLNVRSSTTQSSTYSTKLEPTIYYSKRIYEVKNSLNEDIELTKSFFRNLPDDIKLPKIVIEKEN